MHLPSVPGTHPLFPQQERNRGWGLWLRAYCVPRSPAPEPILVNPGSIQEMPEPQGDTRIGVSTPNPNPSLAIDSPVQESSQGEIDTEANPNPNPHPDLAIWSPLRAQGWGGNSTNPDPDPNTSQAVTVRAEYKREPLMPLKANAMSMGAAVAATLPPTPPHGGGPGRTRTAMEANIVVQHKEAGRDCGGTHSYLAGQGRQDDPTPPSCPPITYSGSGTRVSRGLGRQDHLERWRLARRGA